MAEINGEDTGGLLLRGEIALLQGHLQRAAEQFALACRSNPRAVDGLFLGAFVAWRGGDSGQARELLAQAREALGPDWKPSGAVAEGDVVSRRHREEIPLAHHWQQWDGSGDDPAATFAPLVADLAARGAIRRWWPRAARPSARILPTRGGCLRRPCEVAPRHGRGTYTRPIARGDSS